MSEKSAIAHNNSKPLSDAGRRNTRRKQASKWFFPAVRYKCTHLKRRRNAPQCIGVLLLLFFFYRYALSSHLCENQCNYWSFFSSLLQGVPFLLLYVSLVLIRMLLIFCVPFIKAFFHINFTTGICCSLKLKVLIIEFMQPSLILLWCYLADFTKIMDEMCLIVKAAQMSDHGKRIPLFLQ